MTRPHLGTVRRFGLWRLRHNTVEKRDMRDEIRSHQAPQAFSRHLRTKRLPKQLQPVQSIVAEQHKRMIVRPAPKACDAVEGHLERWHAHLLCSLTCHPNGTLMQASPAIEKKQRYV